LPPTPDPFTSETYLEYAALSYQFLSKAVANT
jgi:hypothetical protein